MLSLFIGNSKYLFLCGPRDKNEKVGCWENAQVMDLVRIANIQLHDFF
jgi:hypothetical protein